MIPTPDGGFMVGGHNDHVTSLTQYWVAKINKMGKVAWDSTYNLGFSQSFLWSIQPTRAGGALLGGYTGVQNSGNESALVAAIDSVGRVVMRHDVNYAKADHAHWCAERKQGGYFWAGHTDSEGDATGQMILERLDDKMDSVWQKTYELAPNSYEHAHCGTLTSDGGCVLAGHTEVGLLEHTWAVRVDSNGKVMWEKLFATSATTDDSPYGMVTTREGGFAIFGGSDDPSVSGSTMRLLVLDSAGNILIDKQYGTNQSWGYSGIQCADGGYAIIGTYSSATKDLAQVVKTNASGKQQWVKQYNGLGTAWAYAMYQRNNQYVMVGGTSATPSATSDLWVLYTDSLGNKANFDTTSKPQLVFTLTTNHATWNDMKSDTLQGTIENPSSDSVAFNYTAQVKPTFFSFTSINGAKPFFNSSQTPITIGPHETLPIMIAIQPYEPKKGDTATICYSLSKVGDSLSPPITNCVTLYPEITGGVGSMADYVTPTLSVFPNPAHIGSQGVSISSTAAIGRLEISTVLGNVVQTLPRSSASQLAWDGKDTHGNRVPAGTYFLRAETPNGIASTKIVIQE